MHDFNVCGVIRIAPNGTIGSLQVHHRDQSLQGHSLAECILQTFSLIVIHNILSDTQKIMIYCIKCSYHIYYNGFSNFYTIISCKQTVLKKFYFKK